MTDLRAAAAAVTDIMDCVRRMEAENRQLRELLAHEVGKACRFITRAENAEDRAAELAKALERCLNYIENTEGELGITLDCGDKARAAIAKAGGEPHD